MSDHDSVEQTTYNQYTPAQMTFWRTVFYSLGNAAGLLTYWTFNTYVQFFYTDVKGVKPEWVGRGWFAFGFWNAVNDPVAGWLSDRTSTRWGRRRFYIGALAIPTSIAFALVWLPPFSGNPTALIVYFLVIISIYDMLQSIITLNMDALFPEMYQETDERAGGSSTRQLIGFIVGTGLAVAFTPTIYGKLGWGALAVLWGTLAAIFNFASLIGIQENPAFADQKMPSWREQIRIVFSNRTFLIVIGINFTMRFILAALLAVLPFYGEYVLKIKEAELTPLLTALLVASGASVVVWQVVVKRRGTRTTMILSMGLAVMFAIPLLFTTNILATGIILALLGGAIGGTILGPDLIFAELIDEDYAHTGQRREGMYRGILGFIFRFPPAVAGLILGEGLALAGYDSDLAVSAQPDAVFTVIRIFLTVLPLIGLALGIALLVIYPLHGDYLRSIQAQVITLRQTTATKSRRDEMRQP